MKKTIINCKLSNFDESKSYFIKRQRFFDELVLKGERYKVLVNNCTFSCLLLEKIKEELKIKEIFLINFTEEKKYFGKTKINSTSVIAYKI